MGQINDLCETCNKMSVSKGFNNTPGEEIALMHSELSEALEEIRKDKPMHMVYASGYCLNSDGTVSIANNKPEGVPIELADCVIRIMHFCGKYGINLEAAIQQKLDYNMTRPFKHGKTM